MKYVLLVLFIVMAPCFAKAAPVVTTTFNYYDISPSGPGDIGAQMDKKSPIREMNHGVAGACQWGVSFKSWIKGGKNQYKVDKVEVTLKVVYTMPRLANSPDSQTAARFQQIFNSVMQHEKGHMNNGLIAARKIEAQLLELPPMADRNELNELARRTSRRIVRDGSMADDNYDRYTQHGIAR